MIYEILFILPEIDLGIFFIVDIINVNVSYIEYSANTITTGQNGSL